MKLNAATRIRILALNNVRSQVIAPPVSFKAENEKNLNRQQNQRESEEDKEATSPNSGMDATAVRDTTASSTPTSTTPSLSLPTAENQYATRAGVRLLALHRMKAGIAGPEDDPLTHQEENACDMQQASAPSTSVSEEVEFEELPGIMLEDQDDSRYGPHEWNNDEDELAEELVLSDADPRLYNMAEQPLG